MANTLWYRYCIRLFIKRFRNLS
ncbi:hypothetical protein BLA29_007400 [Euroglyphus maynei]|uniref:Uncharacterized protein n=1 Tax=Euroglyphus maynei TaxID=6958 RepID=A0A1Y3ARJ7_EURMA|nr:hypothetical protein BLA29_007400 [Euroglyphus maynei]